MKDEGRFREIALRIALMPDAVRSSARNVKSAEATVFFCAAFPAAVTPIKVQIIFLFDADEKTPELRQHITDATQGRAQFLEVRELENLLLDPPSIHEAIAARCLEVGRPEPTVEDIARSLNDALALTADPLLYRQQVGGADPVRVVGSEVLRRLYWEWVLAEYDKIADGKRLAEAVMRHAPERLQPIRHLLSKI